MNYRPRKVEECEIRVSYRARNVAAVRALGSGE